MAGDSKDIVALIRSLADRADETPKELVPAVLVALGSIQGRLTTRLLESTASPPPLDDSSNQDRLMTAEETARILGVTVRWIYRHAGRLPFTKRLSRKALRFSEFGLRRYVKSRT